MLMCNKDSNNNSSDIWKVLVMDKVGRDILSPLFSVKQIRSFGVTLHIMLEERKETIDGVKAIYFISPTYKNIDLLINDIKNKIYEEYYLNFTSFVPKELLQYLAKKSVSISSSDKIQSVFDQHSNFVSLERQLFSLGIKCPLAVGGKTKGNMSESVIEQITCSLLDVFTTLKSVPIIKTRKGGFLEKIAAQVAEEMSKRISEMKEVFEENKFVFLRKRPLLLLVDRREDLVVMLHHSDRYQSLVHDLLEMQKNRVVLESEGGKANEIDLGSDDEFWREHRRDSFTEVADAVHREVEEYKALKEKFSENSAEGQNLVASISQLPAARGKKMSADKHTSLAGALSQRLSSRNLAEMFLVEENLILKGKCEKERLMELIKSSETKREDKARLLSIFILCAKSLSLKDLESCEDALFGSECDIKSSLDSKTIFRALKCAKTRRGIPSRTEEEVLGKKLSDKNNCASGIKPEESHETRGKRIWSSLLDKGSRLFSEVKNFLPNSRLLPVAHLLQTALAPESSPSLSISSLSKLFEDVAFDSKNKKESELDDEMFTTIDPKKLGKTGRGHKKRDYRGSFSEAVVFCVGGGNYTEFLNLQEFAGGMLEGEAGENSNGASRNKKVIYGCTDLVSPEKFLELMAESVEGL